MKLNEQRLIDEWLNDGPKIQPVLQFLEVATAAEMTVGTESRSSLGLHELSI